MVTVPAFHGMRLVVRFAFAGMTAALLAGCADSSRFIGDPLGNPFKSASATSAPTGRDEGDMPPPSPSSYRRAPSYAHTASISAQPLAAPTDMPQRRFASAEAPASYASPVHASPRLASTYVPPRTERTASIAPSSATGHGGWSATGGMAVIAANGESAAILGQRYNVPEDALLRANGFSSASQVHPGTRIVIPVYSATGSAAPAAEPRVAKVEPHVAKVEPRVARAEPRVAKAEPVRKPHDHTSRERLLAKRDIPEPPKAHWVKGPQPAPLNDAKVAAEKKAAEKKFASEQKAAERKVAAAQKAPEKTMALDSKPRGHDKAVAKADPVDQLPADKPVRVAKVEDPAPRKVAVDPTPTASLPPAATEKVSTTGNPEFRWPAHGRIIQGFKAGGNDGINIAVPEGTSVKAAENGVVAYAGSEIKGFGNLVLIRHPNGYVSAYANNGNLEVHRGEQVKRGQTIALSGQSGNVASPQLHFELRKGSTPVDPTRYLAGL